MPKIFSKEEQNKVWEFHKLGLSNSVIARKMNELYPGKWNSSYSRKAVANIIKEKSKNVEMALTTSSEKSLDEMTKDERFKYVQSKLENMPRFKLAFSKFDSDARDVFVDEYLSIIKSTESLTEVEEQSLFMSILELILALQALSRKNIEEKLYDDSMSGKIQPGDVKFRGTVDDRFQKEYEQHMKLYQNGLKDLKMSREQRLKEIRSGRKSLVDLAQELSHKSIQAEVVKEIIRLSKLRDEELKKMLDAGHLMGKFNSE